MALRHRAVVLLALAVTVLLSPAHSTEQHLISNSSSGSRLGTEAGVDTSTPPLVLSLHRKEGWVRARGLLRKGTLPISGAVREVGYFYATVGLGTPTRTFDLIIDTGSTISYVPCKDCKHCGKHKDEAFDVDASSTALRLGCNVPLCNCGSPPCQCVSDKCYYSRSYAEMSSSAGFLIEDHFAFPDSKGPVRLVFGCEADETGEIFRQAADGILGMGNNNNAFQSQLVAQRVIEDTFSLCFGYPSGGTMILGSLPVQNQADMKFTPLKPGMQVHYYTVTTQGITVNGAMANVPATTYAVGYGTVVDSGTTFTYIPSAAFQALVKLVDEAAKAKGLQRTPGSDPQYNDICWKGAPDKALESVFPKLAFVFEPGVSVGMGPMQYLFKMAPGSYCLGIFDNQRSGTLIGGISVRGTLVQYDRRNHRIGFLEDVDCNHLQFAKPHPPPSPEGRRHNKRASPPLDQQLQRPLKDGEAGQGQEAVPEDAGVEGEQGQSAVHLPSQEPAVVPEGEGKADGSSEESGGGGKEIKGQQEGQQEGQLPLQHPSAGDDDGAQEASPKPHALVLGKDGVRGASSSGAGQQGLAWGVVGAAVALGVALVAIQQVYSNRERLYEWTAGGYRRLVQAPEGGMAGEEAGSRAQQGGAARRPVPGAAPAGAGEP